MPYHGVVHCERTYFGSFRTYLGSLQFWLPAQILWTVKTTVLQAKSAANSSKKHQVFHHQLPVLLLEACCPCSILSWSIQQTSSQVLAVCSLPLAPRDAGAWPRCNAQHGHQHPDPQPDATLPRRSPSEALAAKAPKC